MTGVLLLFVADPPKMGRVHVLADLDETIQSEVALSNPIFLAGERKF